ncbi:MAG: hybrid sensor histidine kinase/response regulator [Ardenticatenaceae bacterium]|nr:hybrid sensor histidine kinase/response regulator [Ardenticatenaceae bacterium]
MARILVIDDDRIIRQTLLDGLRLAGEYEVLLAEDGFEGVEFARKYHPDLIICDVEMPRLDGHGVIGRLQKDPHTARIPFIFLTGYGDRGSVRQGMALGADDYISKPFKVSELVEAVETRLKKVSQLEMHYEQKMDALRDSILLALPHELRTPLSLIIGFGEVLSKQGHELPDEKIRSLAQTITRSGRRLHHLFENYIIYAQIELLMTEPDRVERLRFFREATPVSLVERVVEEQKQQNGRCAQVSVNSDDLMLPISSDNLKKIFTELIDNAFKFSPDDSMVSILLERDDKTFVFQVSNEGRGMTPEQIEGVGMYMQFERKIHEQQGTGMGLIIAKRLTELYGGSLMIESTPGEKTMVTVSLPS